jgi:uncharacterized protein with HEPN domain
MSNKTNFELLSLLEAVDKIKLYSQEFSNGEDFYYDSKSFDASMMQFVVIGEVWDIIQNKLLPLKADIEALVNT